MISKYTHNTLQAMGSLIKAARYARGFSQVMLANRLGVTRQTMMAIEKGSPTVSIGTLFEAAYLLDAPLFSKDNNSLLKWQSILPKRVGQKKQKISDDF